MSGLDKFTSGPWQMADYEHAWDEIIGNIDGDCDDERGITCTYTRICEIQDDGPISEQQANARLIAAAPELLAALLDVLGWIPNGGAWHTDAPMKSIARAREALRKATGETA